MNALLVIATFVIMEGATWCIHKFVMHGFLWFLHRDHHDHSNTGIAEKNDWFFVIFAIPAIILMYNGVLHGFTRVFYIGLGITFYGITYFWVHDVFIHQRIKWFKRVKHPYFLAIRRAHKQHHRHTGRKEGECFGFLWVPIKYFKMYSKNTRL